MSPFQPITGSARRWTTALMLAALCAIAVPATARTTATNWSEPMPLTAWVERELTPRLDEVFRRHPRFKGQSLQFVGLRDGTITTEPDELTRSLVQRLQHSLQKTPGVQLWWPPRDDDRVCVAREAPDYHIAMEFVALGADRYRLAVRALDVAERHWVSGFGVEWQGALSRNERRSLATQTGERVAPGRRDNPFTPQQSDLLARALARDLNRSLCGFPGDRVALYLAQSDEATPLHLRVRQLLGHNLSAGRDIVVVDDDQAADLRLVIEVIEIDGDLHQVWVRGNSVDSDSPRMDVNAQAYVRLPPVPAATFAAQAPAAAERSPTTAGKAAPDLASLHVVVPPDLRNCRSADPWRFGRSISTVAPRIAERGCFALDLQVRDDVKVFLLSVDAQNRGQRLLPAACRTFGRARSVMVRGERLQFPVKANAQRRAFRHPGHAGTHSFFAVAASDHAAADQIEAQVARWQDACRGDGRGATGQRSVDVRLAQLYEAVAALDGRAQIQRIDVRYVTDDRATAVRYDDGDRRQ